MFEEAHEEVRHTGALDGEMKKTGKKLAKDMDKIGLKNCFNPNCNRFEQQPKQFAKCTRCGFGEYWFLMNRCVECVERLSADLVLDSSS